MENYEDEEIIRLILFKGDLIESIKYFEHAKLIDDKFVRDGLIKIGIITYAKSFMGNTGIHKEVKNYKVSKSIIPDKFLWIHEMLMNYRGNFIGHSNFKTMKPVFRDSVETPMGNMMQAEYLSIRYDHWFIDDEEFSEFPLLIDQVIELARSLNDNYDIPIYFNKD